MVYISLLFYFVAKLSLFQKTEMCSANKELIYIILLLFLDRLEVTAFTLFIFTIIGLTTCLVIDRYSYKQLISNKFTIPDYKQAPKKPTVDNEFNALRLRDLRIVATLGVGGKLETGSNVVKICS